MLPILNLHSSPVISHCNLILWIRKLRFIKVKQYAHSIPGGKYLHMLTFPLPSLAWHLPGGRSSIVTPLSQACRPGQAHSRCSMNTAELSTATPLASGKAGLHCSLAPWPELLPYSPSCLQSMVTSQLPSVFPELFSSLLSPPSTQSTFPLPPDPK